ncbi:MAG: AIR synthase-related protein [Microthrixaceae bacterium]|nr:AIR synthase-related protein [Microthrixaceae bacterium]
MLGAHDVADGGLGLALAEMVAKSGLGARACRVWRITASCSARLPEGLCSVWIPGTSRL